VNWDTDINFATSSASHLNRISHSHFSGSSSNQRLAIYLDFKPLPASLSAIEARTKGAKLVLIPEPVLARIDAQPPIRAQSAWRLPPLALSAQRILRAVRLLSAPPLLPARLFNSLAGARSLAPTRTMALNGPTGAPFSTQTRSCGRPGPLRLLSEARIQDGSTISCTATDRAIGS